MVQTSTPRAPWWRDAVIYQVYVRSFADSNGDGIGDMTGIRQRLPHLQGLGVDALWLTPFYVSPMADGGYDVADPRDVDPMFGSLDDFDALVADAHDLGLRVIVDIVPNHTSDQHVWFQAAAQAGHGHPNRDRYLFRPGRGAGGELPPNNWESRFGGPAWTRLPDPDGTDGEWYLHLFDSSQPDLNWENPEVHQEYTDILRFWLDRGVDGFRIDVAHGMVKHPDFADIETDEETGLLGTGVVPYFDQDGVHEIYREWRKVLDSYPGERIAVAEAWVEGADRLLRYVRPDELHQAFNFDFLTAAWHAPILRKVIDASISGVTSVGAPVTWVVSNHDVTRHVTRNSDGDPDAGLRRARAATLLMLALPGSAYIYQGEELGLPEVTDLPDDVLQDPVWERSGHTQRGRDGCRVPIPWETARPNFGFTEPDAQPWLPMPAEWGALSVAAQNSDPDSTLSLYRAALRLRREHHALGDGEMEWVESADDVLVFRREPGFVCAVNLSAVPIRLDGRYDVLTASAPIGHDASGITLAADTAIWLKAAS